MASVDFLESIGLSTLPRGFWAKNGKLQQENILAFVQWFEQANNIRDKAGWYAIRGEQINRAGGRGFFTNHKVENPLKESMYALMRFVYPDFDWVPWEFTQVPQGFWNNRDNRLSWCEAFRRKHSILTLDDFYQYTLADWEKFPGRCVSFYGDSPISMLKDLYPDHPWREWRFAGQVSKNFWTDRHGAPIKETLQRWLELEIIQPYNWTKLEDLYKLTQPIIARNYGGGLSTHVINGSPIQLLRLLYPDHDWQFWKFVSAPNNAWDDIENQRKFLMWSFNGDTSVIQERMYAYSLKDLPHGLTLKYKSLYSMAMTCFPDIKWEESKFRGPKTERKLHAFLKKLFPGVIIQYTPEWLVDPSTGRARRFDFYIPELNLVIELDGPQHFKQVWRWLEPAKQARSDVWKMKQANTNGISIIRLLQEEVFENDEEWLERNLLPELIPWPEVTNLFIADEEKLALYDLHESLLTASDACIDADFNDDSASEPEDDGTAAGGAGV